jgi:hypothetical protein
VRSSASDSPVPAIWRGSCSALGDGASHCRRTSQLSRCRRSAPIRRNQCRRPAARRYERCCQSPAVKCDLMNLWPPACGLAAPGLALAVRQLSSGGRCQHHHVSPGEHV